ncbi:MULTISPECIES: hypothetical protein [unclassified Cryobacterium]|uniref:hypothetical protein n=1 Tax=unclassified Cryobacterium TaxID=2649013 RepID=UPI001069FA30|nr:MULTISPECIES: hypothetical protein [unclassified Cryobacterium]TFB96564.1 hypothetical protein E3O39_10865 [Cryobacterium sp. MDB2-A-1]TFC12848.1 hypothetical protein E3O35_08025 [Cryobacterium sp. MDB2-A-2]
MTTSDRVIARMRVNESEVADNLHASVERIIEVTSPKRYAVPLEVSGDALARARRNIRLEVTA